MSGLFGWINRRIPNPPRGPTGWLDIPVRRQVAATLPQYRRGWVQDVEPSKPILLYRAWYDLLKAYPPYPAQQIGDCVSFGHSHGWDLLQAVEVALGNQETYNETFTEFMYGASRKVGGILGNQDGSFGSAAAKAAITIGHVPRTMAYSGQTAKSWGYYGPPDELVSQAVKLGGVALIKDWPTLVSALWNGFPVPICSDQGFAMERDKDGFCAPRGTWNHCMLIAGAQFGRRPGALILQSWGPNVPSGPIGLDAPDFGFWADRNVVERILSQGDSFALMNAPELSGPRLLPPDWTRA